MKGNHRGIHKGQQSSNVVGSVRTVELGLRATGVSRFIPMAFFSEGRYVEV